MYKIRRYARAFIAINLVILATQAQAFRSVDLPWFQRYPHPILEELTSSEFNRMTEYLDGRRDSCVADLHIEFQIYIDRYPQVMNQFQQEEAIERWHQHVLSRPELEMEFCVIDQLTDEIELKARHIPSLADDLFFCNGKVSRESMTEKEREFFALMDRMEYYAEIGSPNAVIFLTDFGVSKPWIINEYELKYFHTLTANTGFADARDHIELLRDESSERLTDEAREFIELAAKAHDTEAILEMVGGCTQERIDWRKFVILDGPPADPPPPVEVPDNYSSNR